MERTGYDSCGMESPPGLPLAERGTRGGSAIGERCRLGGTRACTRGVPAYAAPPSRLGGGHAAVGRLSGSTLDVGQRTRGEWRRGPLRYSACASVCGAGAVRPGLQARTGMCVCRSNGPSVRGIGQGMCARIVGKPRGKYYVPIVRGRCKEGASSASHRRGNLMC